MVNHGVLDGLFTKSKKNPPEDNIPTEATPQEKVDNPPRKSKKNKHPSENGNLGKKNLPQKNNLIMV